ncbi:hypothetical protein ACS127_10580 [Amphibacillus sp. Q70]|uniref:hypothetical protein n=1 Tax=Amphibacillus sp. Q70 TaxID=3453416 RepID=UPI003F859BBA
MINESKKFYKSPAVMILLVISLLLSIAMPIFFIHDYESYDYSTGEEIVITGLNGFKSEREQRQKTSGILTTEKLNDALAFYKSHPDIEKAYFQVEDTYPGFFLLLREAYLPYTGSSEFQVSHLPNVDDFYERNIKQVEEKIDFYGSHSLSNAEKQEALKRAAEIEKPFTFEFIDQWPTLINALFLVYFAIVLSAIIISNQLFSFEKEQNMAIILNAMGRKKLVSIGFKKIFAMLTYLTLEFLICSTIVSSIVLGLLGVSGWHSQIQILPEFFTMIYNLSIGQLYIYYMLIAWLAIMCIALIGAFINSISQKTYPSLIISTLLIAPPLFLKNSGHVAMSVKKFLHIQPINGVNLFAFIDSLFSYNLFDSRILTSTAVLIFTIVCSMISIVLTPFIFTQRLKRN